MNEQLFYWLSFCIIFLFGFLLGCFVAAKFQIFIKFSKKEDYEEKVKELDRMMEEWNKKINEDPSEPLSKKIKTVELFPEDLNRDFGLPREIK